MAKSKVVNDTVASIEFLRTGNTWIDAGIVGLYRVIQRKPPYLIRALDRDDSDSFPQVTADLREDRLVLTGPGDHVQSCLEWAYNQLVACYFNVSTKKQQSDRGAWNFYYDTIGDCFVSFPKKKAVGAASLLFDKAPRPSGQQVTWGNNQE